VEERENEEEGGEAHFALSLSGGVEGAKTVVPVRPECTRN